MNNLLNIDDDDWNIVDGVLKDCWIEGQEEIAIPDGVVEISSCAITCNFEIHTLRIPKSVKIIRNHAFDSNENLKDIYIENPNPIFEYGAFSELDSLENVYVGGERIDVIVTQDELSGERFYCLERYLGKDEFYAVDGDIAEIGEKAFYYNTNLKKVIIPSSVERIMEEAFSGCSNLKEVQIAPNVYSIWNRAFADCKNIIELKLPNTVFDIADEAFDGWTSEQTIYISKEAKRMSKKNKWEKGCKANIIFY